MRRKIAAGNWKMNTTLEEGKDLASEVITLAKEELSEDVDLIMAAPFTHLSSLMALTEGTAIKISAQNCHEEPSGAFTGEISAGMLSALGLEYVVIAHSERREYFAESNQQIAKKVDAVLSNSMTPIFCCGEVLEIREAGNHFDLVSSQVQEALFHLSPEEISKVIIAYEPVWAIGTGVTASSEQAQEMHAHIRKMLEEKFGQTIAESISILYGGSVKPGNAPELFACKDVDGGLIGGASMKARDFIDIAKSF